MRKGFIIFIAILCISLFSRDIIFAQSVDSTPDVCKTATSDDIRQACADYAAENIKLQALQVQLAKQKQKTGGLQKNVNELVAKITSTQAKIKSQIATIAKLSVEINHKIKVISELGNELDREHASMKQLLKKSDELDRKGAAYVLFSANSISSFYQNLDDFFSIKGSLYASVNKVKKVKSATEDQKSQLQDKQSLALDAKSNLEFQKKQIVSSEAEVHKMLDTSKSEEKIVQDTIAEQQKKVAQIQSKLFQFAGGGKAIPFKDAYTYAQAAASATGVRTAFILAILTQESNLGKNVGTCNRTGDPALKSWKNIMNPTRDQSAFLRITAVLGLNPDTTPVSCPIGGGWGGAMGPAQFIPATWEAIASRVANALGSTSANPWNPRDAIMAAGLYLKDRGAVGTTALERNAACRYYSGRACDGKRPPNSFYGNNVMSIARSIQADIDYLEKYGISRR
jgi:membrane-bound lytic murein transglycosylase B